MVNSYKIYNLNDKTIQLSPINNFVVTFSKIEFLTTKNNVNS